MHNPPRCKFSCQAHVICHIGLFPPFFVWNWQVMSRSTVNGVLDRLWNVFGDKEAITGDKLEQSGENDEDYLDESESSKINEFLLYI